MRGLARFSAVARRTVPATCPCNCPRLAKGQPRMFQRLGSLKQGLPVVGQAIALLVAAEQGQAEGRLQPVQAPGDGGHPMRRAWAAPLRVPLRAMARKTRASSQSRGSCIVFP